MSAAPARTPLPTVFLDAVHGGLKSTKPAGPSRDFENRLLQFSEEIFAHPSLNHTTSVLAHEWMRLIGAERVWLLLPRGRRWGIAAVGGVPGFQRRADIVRLLERLVSRVAVSTEPFVWLAGQNQPLPPWLNEILARYLDEAHVAAMRIDPLIAPDSNRACGIIVSESFQPAVESVDEARLSLARRQAAVALELAGDWSRAPLALMLREWKRKFVGRRVLGWSLLAAVVGCGLVQAACLPINDTIEARGELQPVKQRHIFASSPGIVQALQVSTGTTVSAGQELMTLEDAELELEQRRVSGELETVRRRIAALEASRLDYGSATSENVSQFNSLSGDLVEQRQRRDNLQQELELLAQRIKELKVVSPIAGQVVTWDLERLLSRRPVARGQRLLTVAETDGPWQLELRVADEDSHQLGEAIRGDDRPRIDFIVVTMPGVTWSTSVREISQTVEIRAAGELPTILCLADVPPEMTESAAAGLGVRARIHCGRKAAIAVGFQKLWRTIQEHILFPWGF